MLKTNGVGCFISSNKWLRAGYGEKLRQYLLDALKFHIVVDFGELPVFDAATFPAIFLWQNALRDGSTTHWTVVKDLQACYVEGVREHISRLQEILPPTQFGVGKSRLASIHTTSWRETMERSDARLKEYANGQIYYGIKTGLNEAFIIDGETRERLITEDQRSSEIIKPILAGDDVRRYEIHSRGDFLLYVPWELEIENYPAVLRHLTLHKTKLLKRAEVAAQRHSWFALTRYASSYVHKFHQNKIAYPVIGKSLRFAKDTHQFYGNDKTFFIISDDDFLLGVLNSSSVFEYLKMICSILGDENDGGRIEFRGIYLETLPIPNASNDERGAISRLVKETQNLHTTRRSKVEQFLLDIGTSAAGSTSRNVLEQPWNLTEEEFLRRTGSRYNISIFRTAKEETLDLTNQTTRIEQETDERVADLYGVGLSIINR